MHWAHIAKHSNSSGFRCWIKLGDRGWIWDRHGWTAIRVPPTRARAFNARPRALVVSPEDHNGVIPSHEQERPCLCPRDLNGGAQRAHTDQPDPQFIKHKRKQILQNVIFSFKKNDLHFEIIATIAFKTLTGSFSTYFKSKKIFLPRKVCPRSVLKHSVVQFQHNAMKFIFWIV